MEAGFYVAQCASAGVDDLVPVKRSFVDAARPVRPCWRAVGGPATVVACPGAVVVVVVVWAHSGGSTARAGGVQGGCR